MYYKDSYYNKTTLRFVLNTLHALWRHLCLVTQNGCGNYVNLSRNRTSWSSHSELDRIIYIGGSTKRLKRVARDWVHINGPYENTSFESWLSLYGWKSSRKHLKSHSVYLNFSSILYSYSKSILILENRAGQTAG